MALTSIDWILTTASLLAVLGVAWRTRGGRRSEGGDAPTAFFLAGRDMKWWVTAASLFASNIGTEHFVGQAGLAATSGIAVSIYEWAAVYLLVLLGWVFAPVYLKMKLTTIPEYLERRFDARCRLWFVMLVMVTYVVAKIGASLFSGAVVLEVLLGWSVWTSTTIIVIATAIYTAVGGLTAVMFTDTLQTCVFLVGGLIGAIYSLSLVDGISGLKETLDDRQLDWFLHNLHPIDDKDFPWLGLTLGLGLGAALFYWCVDQEMTQRVLSAASLDHAQLGCVAAGYLKLLPFLITVLPGVVARVLYERCLASGGDAFGEWCIEGAEDMSDTSDSNKAYPLLVLREFPTGVKGLMVASFLAAMMSSLSSVFNSASTIFTYDVYVRLLHAHDDVRPERLVFVGRLTTVALTGLALLWLPIIQSSNDGLYLVTSNATVHLVSPLSALFVMALLWPRANALGAFAALVLGSLLSCVRLVLSIVLEDYCDKFTEDEKGRTILRTTWKNAFVCMNFNHFALIVFFFCCGTTVAVSYSSDPPDYEQIKDCLYVWPMRIQRLFPSLKQESANDPEQKRLTQSSSELNETNAHLGHLEVEEEADDRSERRSKQRSTIACVLALVLVIGMTALIESVRATTFKSIDAWGLRECVPENATDASLILLTVHAHRHTHYHGPRNSIAKYDDDD